MSNYKNKSNKDNSKKGETVFGLNLPVISVPEQSNKDSRLYRIESTIYHQVGQYLDMGGKIEKIYEIIEETRSNQSNLGNIVEDENIPAINCTTDLDKCIKGFP
jgi:hypothetical protein